MEVDDFDKKFKKLIKIITTDESKANEFYAIKTVDESYDFACKLVGKLERKKYYAAVKKYVENVDFGNEKK